MQNMKDDVLFVRPSHNKDFLFENIALDGYLAIEPYIGKSILARVARAVWFRFNIPYKSLWYNSRLCKTNPRTIIVYDVLVIPGFLLWLKKTHPNARIVFVYNNLVGSAAHILPSEIPSGICEVWSYDKGDCDRYHLHHYYGGGYFDNMLVPHGEKCIDVMFLGRDKGRAEYLLELEKKINQQGLKTDFHIVADRQHQSRKKHFYKPMVGYDEVRRKLSNCRALINLVLPNQTGITIRDMESIFNGIKLITNNPEIKHTDFYHPNNVFQLSDDNIDEITDFIQKPFVPISKKILEKYTFRSWLNRVLNGFIQV